MKVVVEIEKRPETNSLDTVFISADKEGLEELLRRINRLVSSGSRDHTHLMSEDWGLGDLLARPTIEGNIPIHHLKISVLD
jgi:hypothetical protein